MVAERIHKYIQCRALSVYAVENAVGCSRGAISKAIKDDKSIGSVILENFLSCYSDVNAEWLLTGVGEMFKSKNSNLVENKAGEAENVLREMQKNINTLIETNSQLVESNSQLVEMLKNK